jgi:hypothetical protein
MVFILSHNQWLLLFFVISWNLEKIPVAQAVRNMEADFSVLE